MRESSFSIPETLFLLYQSPDRTPFPNTFDLDTNDRAHLILSNAATMGDCFCVPPSAAILLSEGQILADKPFLDGFATTWLDGEEENRVWIGADGAVENRGPSGAEVKTILELLLNGLTKKTNEIKL
mgnify:CR=1 FL=1